MNILHPKNTTRVIGAPAGWDLALDGDCGALPVVDEVDELSGLPLMCSLWQPSPEDLVVLAAGGAIRLGISGHVHPVVQLSIVGVEELRP